MQEYIESLGLSVLSVPIDCKSVARFVCAFKVHTAMIFNMGVMVWDRIYNRLYGRYDRCMDRLSVRIDQSISMLMYGHKKREQGD